MRIVLRLQQTLKFNRDGFGSHTQRTKTAMAASTLLVKRLKELKLSKKVVDVHRDRLTRNALTGVVNDVNSQFLYMSLYSEEGLSQGISVIQLEDITRIHWGGNARKAIRHLSKLWKTKLQNPKILLTSLRAVIESIQAEYGYVSVDAEYLDDSFCYIGRVTAIDSSHLCLNGFGSISSLDQNHTIIDLEEISRVGAGTQYEESIQTLMERLSSPPDD